MEWSRLSIEVHNAEILIKQKLRLLKFERHSDELLYANRRGEPQPEHCPILTISRRHNLHHLHYCGMAFQTVPSRGALLAYIVM